MSEIKVLGIDLLKKLAKTIVEAVKEVQSDLSDGKMSKMEIIGLADNIISIGRQGLNWDGLLAEAKDIDTAEGREMVDYLISLDVASDKVDAIMVHTIGIVNDVVSTYKNHVVPIVEALK